MIIYGFSILHCRSTMMVSLFFNKLSHNTLMFVKIKVQRLVWTDPCFVSSQIEIGRTGACNVHYSLPDLQAETLSPYHPPLSQPLCFHTPSPYHQPRSIVSSTVSSVTHNEKCRRFLVQLKRK